MSVAATGSSEAAGRRAGAARAAPGTLAMLRAVVHRGLHDNRRAPLTWGGWLGVMCALVAALYHRILSCG